jgi:hypothetical protein
VIVQNEKQKGTAGVSLALVKYVKAFQASVLRVDTFIKR